MGSEKRTEDKVLALCQSVRALESRLMSTHATFGSTATNTGGILPHQLGDCHCQPTSTSGLVRHHLQWPVSLVNPIPEVQSTAVCISVTSSNVLCMDGSLLTCFFRAPGVDSRCDRLVVLSAIS